MQDNKIILGSIAALLLVIVILLAVDMNRSHQTVGESLQDAVRELKRDVTGE